MPETPSTRALRALRTMLLAVADEPLPELDELDRHAQLVALGADEEVVHGGAPSPYLYLIVQGLLRAEATQGGHTVMLGIREEGEIVGDIAAMGFRAVKRLVELDLYPRARSLPDPGGETAAITLTTIEPSLLLRVDSRIIVDLAERHLAWSRVALAVIIVNATTRRAEFTQTRNGTPAESYATLLATRPGLVRRITQRELARLLGVSEAGMSRIVKRVHARGAPEASAQ